jgi:hypothetical protein
MRPAFSSTAQAVAFALVSLTLILSPLLAGKRFLPSREQSYAIEGWNTSPGPWIHDEIFEETNDIDIAFVGSSLMMCGIDTPYVQDALTKKLGRPAVVRSVAWAGNGYDAMYFITRDLLEHRKVHLLVFPGESDEGRYIRNAQTAIWFRYGDDAGELRGLPLREQFYLYAASVIGLPRNLLATVSPVIPMDLYSGSNHLEAAYNTENPARRLGSVSARRESSTSAAGLPFKPMVLPPARDNCVSIYSATNRSAFNFTNQPLPAWESIFGKKFARLAEDKGCHLALIHLPQVNEMHSPLVSEPVYWPDELDVPLTMLGIPPAKFFEGLTTNEVCRLYANSGLARGDNLASHFNQHGQRYFTATITPALIAIYEDQASH